MKNEKLDIKLLDAPTKNHFKMLSATSSLSDDLKILDKVMESNDIKKLKKFLMAVFLSNYEKEIEIYTKSLLDVYDPHSKKLQGKVDKLHDKMLKDMFKNTKLDYKNKINKKHTKKASKSCK